MKVDQSCDFRTVAVRETEFTVSYSEFDIKWKHMMYFILLTQQTDVSNLQHVVGGLKMRHCKIMILTYLLNNKTSSSSKHTKTDLFCKNNDCSCRDNVKFCKLVCGIFPLSDSVHAEQR